jgi:hypothetical protein
VNGAAAEEAGFPKNRDKTIVRRHHWTRHRRERIRIGKEREARRAGAKPNRSAL